MKRVKAGIRNSPELTKSPLTDCLATPLIDELERRSRQFFADGSPLPAPSEMDRLFLGIAEKHHADPFEDEGEEP